MLFKTTEIGLRNRLDDEEISEWAAFSYIFSPVSPSETVDKWLWPLEPSTHFSVYSTFKSTEKFGKTSIKRRLNSSSENLAMKS